MLEALMCHLRDVFPSLTISYLPPSVMPGIIMISHTTPGIRRRLDIRHQDGFEQILLVRNNYRCVAKIDLSYCGSLERLEEVIRLVMMENRQVGICSSGFCNHLVRPTKVVPFSSPPRYSEGVCMPVVEDEVSHCLDWLDRYGLLALTKSPCTDSYHWKHVVEDWCGDYIANGAFITACDLRGVTMRESEGTSAAVAIGESVMKLMRADWQVYEDGIYSADEMRFLRDRLRDGLKKPSEEQVRLCTEFLDANAAKFLTKAPRLSVYYLCEQMKRSGLVVPFGALIMACQACSLKLVRTGGREEHRNDVRVNLGQRILFSAALN